MAPRFDRDRLKIKPLAERVHDVPLSHLLALDDAPPELAEPEMASLRALGERLVAARQAGATEPITRLCIANHRLSFWSVGPIYIPHPQVKDRHPYAKTERQNTETEEIEEFHYLQSTSK